VRQISRKYYSKVSQIETRLINKNSETTEEVRSIIKDYEDAELMLNNVKVLRLSTGEVTATDIKEKIKKMFNEGFKPDLLVVDYFECLVGERGTGSDSEWVREGKTMRKFENMAKDLDMAIWIPSQGNRESTTADLVTVDKLGGSIKKAQIAQVVISVARTLEDTKNQKATLSVLKNRSGSAGVTFSGIKFDNGTCTISCDETIDFDNALSFDAYNEALKTNKEDEFKKEALKMIRAKQQVINEPVYGVGGLPNDFNIK
jgi:replicative DNA helicase